MQNSRYSAGRNVSTCIWCSSDYELAYSRARDNSNFCSKKCEVEARFWLHDQLKAPINREDQQPGAGQ